MTIECWLDWSDWALPLRVYVVTLRRVQVASITLQIGPLHMAATWS